MWGEGATARKGLLVSGWLQGWRLPLFLFERAGSCHLNFRMSAVCSGNVTSSLLYHKPGVRVCVHRVCVHLGVSVCEGVNVSASQYVVCVVSVYRWGVHMRCGMCSHVHVCACVYTCTVCVCAVCACVRPCVWSRRQDQKWKGDAEVRGTVGTGSGRWVQSWFLFTGGGLSMWGVKDSRTRAQSPSCPLFPPPRQKGGCHKCFEVAPACPGGGGWRPEGG